LRRKRWHNVADGVAVELAVAVVAACNVAAEEEACSVGVAEVVWNAVEAWNAVVVVDLAAAVVDLAVAFRPKAAQAVCSVAAQRWARMAAVA
jgi:hypothetical protein